MTNNPNEIRTSVQSLATCFDGRVRLARASELATRGHLLESEVLLCPNQLLPSSPDELDLLARIHVQQGRYADAKRRWEDALKSAGTRGEYEECIKVLENWKKQKYREELLIWRMQLVLCGVAISLTFFLLYRLGLFSHM